MGAVGRVSTETFDPMAYLRAWNFSDLPAERRSKFYRETPRPDGSLLREYEIFAVDREIEIAPGVFFPAWTYNGQVPGPTIRATEGDRIRITFTNGRVASAHDALPRLASARRWTARCREHQVDAGRAVPLRVRCRAVRPAPLPLPRRSAEAPHPQGSVRRVHRRSQGRPAAGGRDGDGDERVRHQLRRRQRGLRGQHRRALTSCTSRSRVKVGELVRIYLVNVTEFDLVNSLHLHGMFFDVFRTGTSLDDERGHRHADALPGRAGDPRDHVPLSRATSCSTRTRASSRSSGGWASSAPRAADVKPETLATRSARREARGLSLPTANLWLIAILPLVLLAGLVVLLLRVGSGRGAARRGAAAGRAPHLPACRAGLRRHSRRPC